MAGGFLTGAVFIETVSTRGYSLGSICDHDGKASRDRSG